MCSKPAKPVSERLVRKTIERVCGDLDIGIKIVLGVRSLNFTFSELITSSGLYPPPKMFISCSVSGHGVLNINVTINEFEGDSSTQPPKNFLSYSRKDVDLTELRVSYAFLRSMGFMIVSCLGSEIDVLFASKPSTPRGRDRDSKSTQSTFEANRFMMKALPYIHLYPKYFNMNRTLLQRVILWQRKMAEIMEIVRRRAQGSTS